MCSKFKKIKCAMFLLLIIMTVSMVAIIKAFASTKSFNFSLDGLERMTSSNYSINGDDFAYHINWTSVVTDGVPADAYHLEVNLQKRNALVFWVSQSNIAYKGPVTGSSIKANFGSNLGKSTIRFKLYNYGALYQAGTLKLVDN